MYNSCMWKYAEDIIEFIAGYRDQDGRLLSPWNRVPSPISLARYDVSILDSLALQTSENNRPYTQKQSQLAVKIITKYRKQLAKLNIHIKEDPATITFRLGIRFVDQSKTIKLQNGKIQIRFPYDPELIKQIKSMALNGYGSVTFDYDNKIWHLGITEFTVNFAVAFGKTLNFEIDPELQILADRIIAIESEPYRIQLQLEGKQLTITNAPQSLVDYVNERCELTINNLYKLVDLSDVLGYSVAPDLLEQLKAELSENEYELVTHRKIQTDKLTLEDIVAYATKTDRLPVYVYDTGTPKKDTDTIIYLNTKKQNKFIKDIKLIVSMSTVLVGFRKQDWLRRAEKVIFLK